jgi:phytanoyl-CoA hydroxylase
MTNTQADYDPATKAHIADALNKVAGRLAPQTAPAAPHLLTPEQVTQWERDGYFIVRAAFDPERCNAINDAAIARVRHVNEVGEAFGGYRQADGSVSVPEENFTGEAINVEDRMSKLFNLHRHGIFNDVATDHVVLHPMLGLLGPDIDCFNSQFIFKNPGAWGQPWHQDSLYFHFDRVPQVGMWLATSEATEANGCLFVSPGSHLDPLHPHIPDRRPDANLGYVEVVDHDYSTAVPVLMEPGDVLLFHSFLLHKSIDNVADTRRTALVYHYAQTGTRAVEQESGTIDWMKVT